MKKKVGNVFNENQYLMARVKSLESEKKKRKEKLVVVVQDRQKAKEVIHILEE